MAAETLLKSLIASLPKEKIYQKFVDVMSALGVDTESWQPGDPTRSTLAAIASREAEWENFDTGFPVMIKGMLLGLSSGSWLTVLLEKNFNVFRDPATYATCTLRVTNNGSEDFGTVDAGDLTTANSNVDGEPNFTNDDAFALGPNDIVDIDITASQAGTASNSQVGEIDTIVGTPFPNVTVTNITAALANDEESDAQATARGQVKNESTSPNGPKGAYEYFAKTPSPENGTALEHGVRAALGLLGEEEPDVEGAKETLSNLVAAKPSTNVTRVRVIPESDFGDAIVFLAGASGALTTDDRDAAEERLETWANPFVINLVVINADNKSIAVTYELWVYDTINLTTSEIEDVVEDYLQAQIKERPIAGDILPGDTTGAIFFDWIKAQIIEAVAPHAFKCTVTAPSGDTALDLTIDTDTPENSSAEVAILGTITGTVHTVVRS